MRWILPPGFVRETRWSIGKNANNAPCTLAPISNIESLDSCAISVVNLMWFPSSLFMSHTMRFESHLFLLSFVDVTKLKEGIFRYIIAVNQNTIILHKSIGSLQWLVSLIGARVQAEKQKLESVENIPAFWDGRTLVNLWRVMTLIFPWRRRGGAVHRV